MAVMGSFDARQIELLRDNLSNVTQTDVDIFFKQCANELTARLLRKVQRRTPVGIYPASSGKTGGTLRRNWTIGDIVRSGNMYTVEIINPTEYASYVEYGHRTRNHAGWIEGKFMMTISENELKEQAPSILNQRFETFLRSVFT